MARFPVRWFPVAKVEWETWWLDQHGPTRSRIPDLLDLIGFANFDLKQSGSFARLEFHSESGEIDLVVSDNPCEADLGWIGRHGFLLDG